MDTFTELGGRFYAAQGLAEMGRSVFALGNEAEAQRVWNESLRIATEIHGTSVALEALLGLARLQAKRGYLETAIELVMIVQNHSAVVQETKNRAALLRHELEAQLANHQIEAAQARVQAKTFEVAVEKLLQQTEDEQRTLRA